MWCKQAGLALLLVAVGRCAAAADLIWATSGGGMVANVADMGWANAFASLGLFDRNRTDGGGGASVGSVSSNSGGTWFTLQFFYSSLFYDAISTSTPEATRSFVLEYLTSYDTIWPTDFEDAASTPGAPECDPLKPFAQASPSFQILLEYCYAAYLFDFDWAKYTEAHFESTASSYGEDGTALASRPVTDANKTPDLSGVTLTLQTSLAANSRSSVTGATGELLMSYVGPASEDATGSRAVFTQPMPLQWVCGSEGDEYWGPAGFLEGLTTYTGFAPASFDIRDWSGEFDEFPPPIDASPLTNLTVNVTEGGKFSPMFGGEPPTVTQIGAASSADNLGGGIPSALAQFHSFAMFTIENNQDFSIVQKGEAKLAVKETFDALYANVLTNNVNVCTDWTPEGDSGCPPNHGRLIDGGYADDSTITSALSSYQIGRSTPGEDDHLKIIFTYNADNSDDNMSLRYLFSTPENMGDAPGGFFWAPGDRLPHPQRQVFTEFLTSHDIDSLLEAIPDTNMSTAVINATTVDNPTFGVSAGLSVSILVLKLSPVDLPMMLFNEPSLNIQYADLAHEIASSQVLKQRIKDFVGGDVDTFGPTGTPTAPQLSSTPEPTGGSSATSGAPTASKVSPTPQPTEAGTTSVATESPTNAKPSTPSSGSFVKASLSAAAWTIALLLQTLCG